jgi:magnesium chelatase family protein
MISKVLSATVIGLEAQLIHVEIHFSTGQSKFFLVGLPDKACSESKERVSAIIKNYRGLRLPAGPFTVNLAPADIQKSGPVYDLPIALGILHSLGEVEFDPSDKIIIGELSLDGKTRNTNAILPIADLARRKKIKKIFVPSVNAQEASIIPGVKVFPVKTLDELVRHLNGQEKIKPIRKRHMLKDIERKEEFASDIALVQGQEHAKRALTIAAAGGHNILMSGSPGSGKTMLSRTLPTILPRLTLEESLEVTRVYSVAGLLPAKKGLIARRPFRKPHHTISHVALVGGGTIPGPGEISLAHRGVLFLDEFSEFSNKALEALRQPLEDGVVTISRAKATLTFPARLMLVAAMNPCKCGWLGDDKHKCTCSPSDIIRYRKRISGPVLDRIDMQIAVKRVEFDKMNSKKKNKSSKKVQSEVQNARNLQQERFQKLPIVSNSEMGQREINKFIKLSSSSKNLIKKAMNSMNLSARSYYRVLRVARTIADLDGELNISKANIAEALSYRIGEDNL